MSDKEKIKTLHEALEAASNHLDYCGYGDKWEREGTGELQAQIGRALEIKIDENINITPTEKEILEITREYHRQLNKKCYVDSPGGLEHMGDVWRLLLKWEEQIKNKKL